MLYKSSVGKVIYEAEEESGAEFWKEYGKWPSPIMLQMKPTRFGALGITGQKIQTNLYFLTLHGCCFYPKIVVIETACTCTQERHPEDILHWLYRCTCIL